MTALFVSPFTGLALLLLWGQTAAAVFLTVSPNRQQFFLGEAVRLSCEEEEGSSAAGLTLRKIVTDKTQTCGIDEGFGKCDGSTYTVSTLSSADHGTYWCEDSKGQRSINVTITVTDCAFILDIPGLPVMVGSEVTLRCRDRRGSTVPVNLVKFGRHNKPLTAAPVGQLTIRDVQWSDGGFYWCYNHSVTCPSSYLTVTASPVRSITSAPSLLQVILHLVVISPYCVSTGLMISLLRSKKTDRSATVAMEMEEHAERDKELEKEYINAAAVTTEHHF